MAFNFLKNILSKKEKGFSNQEIDEFVDYLKENNLTFKEEDLEKYESPETESDLELKEENKVRQEISERLAVSVNSPVKLLWNIYNEGQQDKDYFAPSEYIVDCAVETNEKINELKLAESPLAEFESFDDNQKDIIRFSDIVQRESVKCIKGIFSADSDIDKYMSDIDEKEFDRILQKCSVYKSLQELKNTLKKNKNGSVQPNDAKLVVSISKDKLHAWAFAIPPFNGGAELTADTLKETLGEEGVSFGINKDAVAKIIKNREYFKILEIARGREVVNGRDGYVENLFSTENTINIKEDIHGNINYKELNNVQNVHAGDVISKIFYPVEGKDGKRVDGKVIVCKKGKNPKIPSGRNTSVTEDGSQLVSDINGELSYQNNVFNVNELLTIDHDVDLSIGNIKFAGDVLIKGDVREGFAVEADGNVTIIGTVEGAKIVSRGDLTIKYGMTGGNKGVIRTDGNLNCIFLENCKVYAKGDINVGQVMYSEVASDRTITISGSKGSVTGGKIIAGKNITANIIGAANNPCLKTEIVLGCTPHMLKKYNSLVKMQTDTEEKISKLNQDIRYIESNIENATEERKEMLEKMKIQLKFSNIQKESINKNLEKLAAEIEECTKTCSLKCNELNPIININMGDSQYTLKEPLKVCKIYNKDGNAVLSSASLVENIVF